MQLNLLDKPVVNYSSDDYHRGNLWYQLKKNTSGEQQFSFQMHEIWLNSEKFPVKFRGIDTLKWFIRTSLFFCSLKCIDTSISINIIVLKIKVVSLEFVEWLENWLIGKTNNQAMGLWGKKPTWLIYWKYIWWFGHRRTESYM